MKAQLCSHSIELLFIFTFVFIIVVIQFLSAQPIQIGLFSNTSPNSINSQPHNFAPIDSVKGQSTHAYSSLNKTWLRSVLWHSFQNRSYGQFQRFLDRDFPETLIRKARSIVGNTERLKLVLGKIQNGTCVRICVLGASVSAGHNVGFPCTGGQHEAFLIAVGGLSSKGVVDNWYSIIDKAGDIDMIFVEFGANDPFAGDKVTSWMENPNKRLDTKLESLQWLTEIIIRRIQRLRKPAPVAMMWVEMSFWYERSYLNPRDHNKSGFRYREFGDMGSYGHYAMLSYYDIPTISTIEMAVQIIFSKEDSFDDRNNPFYDLTSDKCCHPRAFFHVLTAMVIAYNFEKEMEWAPRVISSYQEDFSMRNPPIYRLPWRLTEDEIKNWVDLKYATIDFSDEDSVSLLKTNRGWKYRADSKDKFGLIATEAYAHMSLELNFTLDLTFVIIGFLQSYENVSPTNVWFSDNDDDILCDTCGKIDCSCQSLSNRFGIRPGNFKCAWNFKLIQYIWNEKGCGTEPENSDWKTCEKVKGIAERNEFEELARKSSFDVIFPLRTKSNVSVYNSHLIEVPKKGVRHIHFCLRKSVPYQKFKLLSISYPISSDN